MINLRGLITLLLMMIGLMLHAQFKDDFSDGVLNENSQYSGEVSDFIINEDFRLQLNAADAGVSSLFTNINFTDSTKWQFDFEMDFAPSSSNKLEIILWSDVTDLSVANAFTLQIGENGSDDAINFIQYTAGQATMLASTSMGSVSQDPVNVSMEITKTASDEWTLKADYDGTTADDLLTLNFNTPDLTGQSLFGVLCTYSASRADKFFFDNICIDALLPDTEAPKVDRVEVLDDQSLLVFFDEAIDMAVEQQLSAFMVEGVGSPASISLTNDSQVELMFKAAFASGMANTLTVEGVSDLAGNVSSEQQLDFFLVENPELGDLLINEVLFDPFPNGTDFIELYNYSDKILTLDQLSIANLTKEDIKVVPAGIVLQPSEYILLSEDNAFLEANYIIEDPDALVETDLPSFNNDSGNYSILVDGMVIDSFDYEEDFHFVLIDDTEGVSLERLSFETETNLLANWNSAASIAGFATPGYQNSNQLNINPGEEMFSLAEKVFSPNEDGDGDALIINYSLEQPGFIGSVKVFDARGREEYSLINNELLSAEGFVKWDGINNLGERSPIGIYIVYFSVFNESGEVFNKKMSCVLADFLD